VTCCISITRRHATCHKHLDGGNARELVGLVLALGDDVPASAGSPITDGCVRLPDGP
jgi:hypothetical protein